MFLKAFRLNYEIHDAPRQWAVFGAFLVFIAGLLIGGHMQEAQDRTHPPTISPRPAPTPRIREAPFYIIEPETTAAPLSN